MYHSRAAPFYLLPNYFGYDSASRKWRKIVLLKGCFVII